MALEGAKDIPFTVKLRMENAIHCGHLVKLSAAGITISKDGVDAHPTIDYTFTPDNWNTDQDVRVLGHKVGDFTIKADITSAFYQSFNTLKIKKDQINVRIVEFPPDGWQGDTHGLRFGTGDEGGCVDNDLYLTYTLTPTKGSAVIKITGNFIGNSMSIIMSGPAHDYQDNVGSASTTGLTFGVTVPGTYTFKVYGAGSWGTAILGAVSCIWFEDGVMQSSGGGRQRGLQISAGDTDSTPYDVAFSKAFGTPSDEYEKYLSFDFVPPFAINGVPYTGVPPENFSGSVSYADGVGFTASGQWKNYFIGGETLQAGARSNNHPSGASPVGISASLGHS